MSLRFLFIILFYLPSQGSQVSSASAGGGGGANTDLSNLAAVAINSPLLPNLPSAYDFGGSGLYWHNVWLSGALVDSSDVVSYDASTRIIFDTDGNDSVSADDRRLVNGDSSTAIDWSALGVIIANANILTLPTTVTSGGTTGAQTIDKISGCVNFAASASSLVVTDAYAASSSIIMGMVETNDSTSILKNIVPATGSFTIRLTATATAETRVCFFIING